ILKNIQLDHILLAVIRIKMQRSLEQLEKELQAKEAELAQLKLQKSYQEQDPVFYISKFFNISKDFSLEIHQLSDEVGILKEEIKDTKYTLNSSANPLKRIGPMFTIR